MVANVVVGMVAGMVADVVVGVVAGGAFVILERQAVTGSCHLASCHLAFTRTVGGRLIYVFLGHSVCMAEPRDTCSSKIGETRVPEPESFAANHQR